MVNIKHIQGLLRSLLFVLIAVSFSACDKEKPTESVPVVPFQLDQTELTLQTGDVAKIAITGGSGEFVTSIGNVGILTASVTQSEITLHALRPGEERLKVTDRVTNETKEVKVSIESEAQFAVTPNVALLYAGTYKVFHMTEGSGDYTAVVKDEKIVSVTALEGGQLTLKAGSFGETVVTVTDNASKAVAELPVKVELRPFAVSSASVEFPMKDTYRLSIVSGNGNYSVKVDKPGIIEASVVNDQVVIKSLGIGEALLTLTDEELKESREIKVKVTPRRLVVSSNAVQVPVGFGLSVPVKDGNGVYRVEVIDGAELIEATLSGDVILIKSIKKGRASVKVADMISKEEAVLSVTVRDLITNSNFLTTSLSIKQGETASIQTQNLGYNLYYYKLDYDKEIIDVKPIVWQGRYEVTGKKPGSILLTVTDSWGGEVLVEIPVTVTE